MYEKCLPYNPISKASSFCQTNFQMNVIFCQSLSFSIQIYALMCLSKNSIKTVEKSVEYILWDRLLKAVKIKIT